MGVRQKMKAIKSLKYKDFMEKRYLNGVQEAGSSNLLTQTMKPRKIQHLAGFSYAETYTHYPSKTAFPQVYGGQNGGQFFPLIIFAQVRMSFALLPAPAYQWQQRLKPVPLAQGEGLCPDQRNNQINRRLVPPFPVPLLSPVRFRAGR